MYFENLKLHIFKLKGFVYSKSVKKIHCSIFIVIHMRFQIMVFSCKQKTQKKKTPILYRTVLLFDYFVHGVMTFTHLHEIDVLLINNKYL